MSDPLKAKILAVDDDQRNLVIMQHFLQQYYEFKAVQSGEEAWQLVQSFMPDIILLDIVMPGMGGFELCKKIRGNKKLQYIKIILVSGKSNLDSRLKGYEFGADDYITKPFEPDELHAKIKVFLRLKHFEEVDSLKSSFLNLISHETKTPISHILGYGELLLNTQLTDEQKEWVQIIMQATHLLHENSNKIILLSQLKKGMSLIKSKSSIRDLLSSLVTAHTPQSVLKNIAIELKPENDFAIEADLPLLKQALQYVIENALNHAPTGTCITVHYELKDLECLIHVSDQGPGILASPIEEIFSEFSVKDILHHQEGLKISLAISKAIVEMHGGSLTAVNNPDQGATFHFRFPIN